MRASKFAELHKLWGNKPCDHPSLEKEYDLGAATGAHCCVRCGECFYNGNIPKNDNPPHKNR